jgi:transcriptional regulator with XRE-family HTH domain
MHPIQEIRKAASLSQAALARELSVTQSTISQYERGEIRPDVSRALRLLEIAKGLKLHIRLEDIYRPTPELASSEQEGTHA